MTVYHRIFLFVRPVFNFMFRVVVVVVGVSLLFLGFISEAEAGNRGRRQ